MKKNVLLKVVSVSAAAVCFAAFTACGNSQSLNTSVNNASAGVSDLKAVTQSMVSLDNAIDIALDAAGIARENASFVKTELDSDNTVPAYEIDFTADGIEYEYEIAVNDGKILEAKKEAADSIDSTKNQQSQAVESENNVSPSDDKAPTNPQSAGYISVDAAKTAALKDAGINSSDANFVKAEFDKDDLIPSYDIEFICGGYKYDYEINAKTGTIIEKDKEVTFEKKNSTVSNPNPDFISESEAKAIAFDKAGIKESDAKNVKVSFDGDDIIPSFDVNFIFENYEYEYEINAKTGRIIAGEKEFRD